MEDYTKLNKVSSVEGGDVAVVVYGLTKHYNYCLSIIVKRNTLDTLPTTSGFNNISGVTGGVFVCGWDVKD